MFGDDDLNAQERAVRSSLLEVVYPGNPCDWVFVHHIFLKSDCAVNKLRGPRRPLVYADSSKVVSACVAGQKFVILLVNKPTADLVGVARVSVQVQVRIRIDLSVEKLERV